MWSALLLVGLVGIGTPNWPEDQQKAEFKQGKLYERWEGDAKSLLESYSIVRRKSSEVEYPLSGTFSIVKRENWREFGEDDLRLRNLVWKVVPGEIIVSEITRRYDYSNAFSELRVFKTVEVVLDSYFSTRLSYLDRNREDANSKNLSTSLKIVFKGINFHLSNDDEGQIQLRLLTESLKNNKPVKIYGTLSFFAYSETVDDLVKNWENNMLYFELDRVEPVEEK